MPFLPAICHVDCTQTDNHGASISNIGPSSVQPNQRTMRQAGLCNFARDHIWGSSSNRLLNEAAGEQVAVVSNQDIRPAWSCRLSLDRKPQKFLARKGCNKIPDQAKQIALYSLSPSTWASRLRALIACIAFRPVT